MLVCWSANKGRKSKNSKIFSQDNILVCKKYVFFLHNLFVCWKLNITLLLIFVLLQIQILIFSVERWMSMDGVGRRSSTWIAKGKSTLVSFWLFPCSVSVWKCNLLGHFLLRILQRHSGYESLHNILKTFHPLFVCSSECANNKPGLLNSTQL